MTTDQAPLCKCGCGGLTKWNKNTRRFGQFISGHNGKMGRRKLWPILNCDNCQKDYEVRPYILSSIGSHKFCSKGCRDGFRRRMIGEANPCYQARIASVCQVCQEPVLVLPTRLARGENIYCSMSCGREGRRRQIAGRPRRGTRLPSGILAVKKRDAFACRMCGFSAVIHGHHIVPKTNGGSNDLDNLITLCPNHHALAHAGILTAKEMKKAISLPIDLLAIAAAKTVRPKGTLNKTFYRTDLAPAFAPSEGR